jgi:hypothetical protein
MKTSTKPERSPALLASLADVDDMEERIRSLTLGAAVGDAPEVLGACLRIRRALGELRTAIHQAAREHRGTA